MRDGDTAPDVCATPGAVEHCKYELAPDAVALRRGEARLRLPRMDGRLHRHRLLRGPDVGSAAGGRVVPGPAHVDGADHERGGGPGSCRTPPPPPGPVGVRQPGPAGRVECTFQYPPDTVVTLSRLAYPDSKFLGYCGPCSGTEPCSGRCRRRRAQVRSWMPYLGPRTLTVQITSVEGGPGPGGPRRRSPVPSACDNSMQPDVRAVPVPLPAGHVRDAVAAGLPGLEVPGLERGVFGHRAVPTCRRRRARVPSWHAVPGSAHADGVDDERGGRAGYVSVTPPPLYPDPAGCDNSMQPDVPWSASSGTRRTRW